MSEATTCAIIGGGPAGMVLGLLLARAGVEVTVLEKHADFLRDFRGDTVHPSTLELLEELGLYEGFAALPHSRIRQVTFPLGRGESVTLADFRRLRLAHPYIAMVPQWDLLNLLAEAARAEPTFTLRMSTEATGLLWESGRVAGVRYRGPDGPGELRAELTVACDGRWSVARRQAGLAARESPVSFDAWWFKIPTGAGAPSAFLPRSKPGRMFVTIPRQGYLQIAYLARKGTDTRLRARGIEAFRRDIVEVIPELACSVGALTSMDEVKHLDVRVNRLRRWHAPGLLCIGDAAHAMSPVGGVGINLAVQDAVAAATLLAGPLREHRVTDRDLAAVRRRRLLPTVATQALQRVLHRQVIGPILAGRSATPPPFLLALTRRFPWLSAVPAYIVGVGVRPEHAPAFARRAPHRPARPARPA
ncbi:2-polyprenyl-6-methoxyphenol hydroxylase [Thermomonospora echinospora]|uniref:2-polyprenyl-6-methoxyphenol hydroxylase n=1 Tax=Thermomonospora echinospora TaxID=1992 RepID=A0A1H6DHF8_9ACTN|nr:FAD-dependent oxidoreductase [Thermomonospora echinospora]SEG84897.1 2-polyprenyl-6-methoxyphenol hydroxylase [Thermomonospora echinospora]